ncbi:bleomycin resistance protein [Prauserella sp. PE36]|uniref:VOC family protein n=1 Tax=Prauserella endophytica TaxID=1592324 RepID=A0ABY2RZD4_9PSEU|nr:MULTISPECIES: VOC family protein [Prauserella]PXY24905.1 bleomycin resistance protein [Prauserella coralliicola]RBM16949.1 bleomycin resistance protein [Prauserella sp. PE36]TKG66661.1 VOC family protein [Prauserella endophytica]
MKISLTSVLVDDQDKALAFYTGVLGFVKKNEFPAGGAKWLTVISPDGPDDVELLLEPDANPAVVIDGRPAAQVYKQALYDAGIPWTTFTVDDVHEEYERLSALGVRFQGEPTLTGEVNSAVFDDTCGNLIMIVSA